MQEARDDQEYTRALSLVDSVIQRAPDHVPLYTLKGELLSSLYRFEGAAEAYAVARARAPRLAGVAYAMGGNAFFLGDYRQALEHYHDEIEILARRDTTARNAVWAQIGRTLARMGVRDSAAMAYEQALAYRTTNAAVWGWYAELHEEDGDLELAWEHAARAAALEPEEADWAYLAGSLGYRLGRLEAAERYLSTVLERKPRHVGANYNMGRMLVEVGREAAAEPYLMLADQMQAIQADIILARFAVERAPQDASRWHTLAELHALAGELDQAREARAIGSQLN